MGVKGSTDTKLDSAALNEIVVYSNMYAREVEQAADEIRTVCRKMEDEESLKGGDGDAIRANFELIAKGATHISRSAQEISKILDDKLGTIIKMNKGSYSDASGEAAKKAADAAGVVKKQ